MMLNKPVAVMFTDVHLTDKERENDAIIDVIGQIIAYCTKNNIKQAFFAGDMFTDRASQPLMTIRYYHRILQMFKYADIMLYGIAGNHDKTDLDDTYSYMNCAIPYEDVTKISHFELFPIYGIVMVNNMAVCMVPYFDDKEIYELTEAKFKEIIPERLIKILITHQAYTGVKNNNGDKVEDGLNAKNTSYFKKIFVGHYHNRSVVGNNIYYFGSIRQADYGEDDQKGFCVLYENGDHKYVNTKFKNFKHIKMDVNDIDEEFLPAMLKLSNGINLRITFSCTFETKHKIPISELMSMGIDVRTDNMELMVGLESSLDESFERLDKEKLLSEWKTYAKQNKVPAKIMVNGMIKLNSFLK